MKWTVVAVSCALLLGGGCAIVPEEPPFEDLGRGTWFAEDAPELGYLAVWGASPQSIFAVGKGGIAELDGQTWSAVEGVPATTYRAVWGRSSSQLWIGGDGAMLARSLTGWQQQPLDQDGEIVTDYSVLAIAGTSAREYALVRTGGKILLFENQGASWETVLWRGADGPSWPLPEEPTLLVRDGWSMLIGGGDRLLACGTQDDYGIATWDAYPTPETDLPRLRGMSGGADFWAAAGGAYVLVERDGDEEPAITGDERSATAARDARGIFAAAANQLYVVGEPVRLTGADPISGVTASPIEACDGERCALEAIDAGREDTTLRAIWGDGQGTVVAAGDGAIFVRRSK